jgi:hypothetical protein
MTHYLGGDADDECRGLPLPTFLESRWGRTTFSTNTLVRPQQRAAATSVRANDRRRIDVCYEDVQQLVAKVAKSASFKLLIP